MKTRLVEGGGLAYWCQGCNDVHVIDTARWSWDGNRDRPTISPSVLVRSGCKATGHKPGDSCWCTYNAEQRAKGEPEVDFGCTVCHTFIKDGMVQFLSDCSHDKAGQTLPLPEFPQ